MSYPSSADPAELIASWETVEELLVAVPEGPAKDVLRMVAGGFSAGEIAYELRLPVDEVVALAARGRMRVLTAALAADGRE